MSAPEFTAEEMVATMKAAERGAMLSATVGLYGTGWVDPNDPARLQCERGARLYAAIAARLSDPWSAFAGWQPPPEPERADGFRYLGWSLGGGLWEEIVWWSDRGGRWSDATGNTLRGTHAPTAFAPLPPPPKESTNG